MIVCKDLPDAVPILSAKTEERSLATEAETESQLVSALTFLLSVFIHGVIFALLASHFSGKRTKLPDIIVPVALITIAHEKGETASTSMVAMQAAPAPALAQPAPVPAPALAQPEAEENLPLPKKETAETAQKPAKRRKTTRPRPASSLPEISTPANPATDTEPQPVENSSASTESQEAKTQEILDRYAHEIAVWVNHYYITPSGITQDATPIIRLRINRQGTVTYSALEKGSGNSAIDNAALSMVKMASPVPPIPASYTADEQVEFLLPILFTAK